MSESVVADFVGRFHAAHLDSAEPVRGRVLLSQRRLVLASENGKTTVPLSAVFDVSVGFVPPDLQAFFSDTVTVAYKRGNGRQVAVIEGEGDTVDRFTAVFFKAILNGAKARVKHPARIGGRVTDADVARAVLSLRPGGLSFQNLPEPVTIDLGAVTDIQREKRALNGSAADVLTVRHMPQDTALTSVVGLSSKRLTNVLGRYIRLEYGDLVEEARELSPTEEELEALYALYTTGGTANLGGLLGADASQVSMVLNSLEADGLISNAGDATTLTAKGRIVVNSRMEEINGMQ